jgi:D-3-phosphoglycerate dehydrogenase
MPSSDQPSNHRSAQVIATSRSFGAVSREPIAILERAGLTWVRADTTHRLEDIAASLAHAVAWIAGTAPVTAAHMDLAPDLQVIARYGTGVDSVDLAAAAARGVIVTNTPGANAEAVADHTIALLLAALRHVVPGDQAMRAGQYPALRGRELGALTVGLLGFGRVGRGVARRLVGGFGARVLAYDPFVAPEVVRAGLAEPVAEVAHLASQVDVLSLHLPAADRSVVDATLLGLVRPGCILINTARGDLLDEAAVAAALQRGQLGAAALDVLADEVGLRSPLLDAPRTIITPHLGAQTVEAIDRMGCMAADEVVRVLAGQTPLFRVV